MFLSSVFGPSDDCFENGLLSSLDGIIYGVSYLDNLFLKVIPL
jgi:hypothetical protein